MGDSDSDDNGEYKAMTGDDFFSRNESDPLFMDNLESDVMRWG